MSANLASEFDDLVKACLERAQQTSNADEEAHWIAMALELSRLAAAARNSPQQESDQRSFGC
jgi:hypothetical protein